MPYIKKQDRKKFDPLIEKINLGKAGEVNYVITKLVHRYLKKKGINYDNLNEVIGVLEAAKLELYRKIAAPYEEEKIAKNGRVGELDIEKQK